MSLLEVRNLKTFFSTRRGEVRSVDDVSFTLEQGETLSLVVESGCRRDEGCGHPRAGGSRQKLPARDVGRDATARDDRHGAGLRPEAPDRRRAYDRARRDNPGPDSGDADRVA